MYETFGVIGSGNASRKVIEAGLKDLGNSESFIVPWYGKVTPGLETVYDWLLDNEVKFTIVSTDSGKAVPKALAEKAVAVEKTDDVNYKILRDLKSRDITGISLILWDAENEEESMRLSYMSIDMKLSTLELTNGLLPIVFDDVEREQPKEVKTTSVDEMPDLGDASYARETLEVMPAALVRRMAKDKGIATKTKEEAIDALAPKESIVGPHDEIGSIIFLMKDGTEIGFNGTLELLNKIMEVVAEHQKRW
jgi:hypothetical protein